MKKRLLISFFAMAWSLATMAPALAGDLVVTRYFSGLWNQPHQESQGIVLQVIDQEDEEGDPKAVAYWFTYGDDMQSAWYMAVGQVEGDQVLMDLYAAYDVGFMQEESPEVNPVEAEGTLNLTFKNCNKGMASYTMGDDGGEFEISRLASLYNSRCSGGISDNTPGDAKPLMLQVELLPEGGDAESKGKAKFWERSDRSDFHVSAENLKDGEYKIFVCGENVGDLTIVEGEGATRFRSPEAEGQLNLSFDPRECTIEIQQAGALFLTSGDKFLGGKEKGSDDDDSDSDDDGDSLMEIEVELENTGIIIDAEGEVEYEVKKNRSELEVEIEDVPAGSYGFFVGGEMKGSMEVKEGQDEGKLILSDPARGNTQLLDFEPWDMLIEVKDSDTQVILSTTFPSAP